jgi:hypothetical protein
MGAGGAAAGMVAVGVAVAAGGAGAEDVVDVAVVSVSVFVVVVSVVVVSVVVGHGIVTFGSGAVTVVSGHLPDDTSDPSASAETLSPASPTRDAPMATEILRAPSLKPIMAFSFSSAAERLCE